MRLGDLPRILLRRWYLVLIGVLCTAALAVFAGYQVPPRQEMSASILLLPPTTSVGTGGNPYLALSGLEAATDVLARSMSDVSVQRQVEAVGSATYTVDRDQSSAAPILLITVDADSRNTARAALGLLVKRVPETLLGIQQSVDVPQDALISSSVVTSSVDPEVSYTPRLRAILVAIAAGFAITLFGTVLLDLLLGRRASPRGRRRARTTTARRHGSNSRTAAGGQATDVSTNGLEDDSAQPRAPIPTGSAPHEGDEPNGAPVRNPHAAHPPAPSMPRP